MGRIERFEDIVAWQKARELSRQIYDCSKAGGFARDFGLKDQIQRASVSAMANIAEGFERGGDKEFIQFLSNSKGSSGDQQYVTDDRFKSLYQQADEVSRLVAGIMGYLQQSTVRGHKFKRAN